MLLLVAGRDLCILSCPAESGVIADALHFGFALPYPYMGIRLTMNNLVPDKISTVSRYWKRPLRHPAWIGD